MEWNRGSRPNQPVSAPVNHSTGASSTPTKNKKLSLGGLKLASIILLFSATALIVALLVYIALGNKGSSAAQQVDTTKMQAVFLNGGQVYFGKISDLNSQTMQLKNIYYLRVNQQVQPNQSESQAANDISLVKLGCELHGPQDSMVINQEQVIFWENLKEDGQVAQAVKKYNEDNPQGQKCEQGAAQQPVTDSAPAQQNNQPPQNNNTQQNNTQRR